MEARVYVGNLSFDATEESVRTHFAAHGVVSEVQLTSDRYSGARSASALVVMTTEADAEQVVARLHGSALDGRTLRVTPASRGRADGERGRERGVKIAQQFRERNAMTYDLDCSGTPLTVRIFPTAGEQWRIEARTSDATDAFVAAASASNRRQALDEVGRCWRDNAPGRGLATFDWEAIAAAMAAVRAVE